MAHNGQLIRTGIYIYLGVEQHSLFAQVIHSETGKIYFLLSCNASTPHPQPLGISFERFTSQSPPEFRLAKPCVFVDIAHYLKQEIEPGTYGHYKSTPENQKLYNVLGTATLLNDGDEKVVIYHPLYGQQILMARPLNAVDPAVDNGAFTQDVNKPDYQGPRFTRIGDLTK